MNRLFQFDNTHKRDPDVEAWLDEHEGHLGAIARDWFVILRECGEDVTEILHDGHPTACVDGTAFAYVNAFRAHINVGFFHGAELDDPDKILEGTGKFMRHVKIRPEIGVDEKALEALIRQAYDDIKKRLGK